MKESLEKLIQGYKKFRAKYAEGDLGIMEHLSEQGQQPHTMVVACCDSRVDPALILQCDPGDLFVVRNVANIVPPYAKDSQHHGTSAALEFGICFLQVKHLILFAHSQCGGIRALVDSQRHTHILPNDFIHNWVSIINLSPDELNSNYDDCAKAALKQSFNHCLSFPWIQERFSQQTLIIHLWYFDIKSGQIFKYQEASGDYQLLCP